MRSSPGRADEVGASRDGVAPPNGSPSLGVGLTNLEQRLRRFAGDADRTLKRVEESRDRMQQALQNDQTGIAALTAAIDKRVITYWFMALYCAASRRSARGLSSAAASSAAGSSW